MATISSNRCSAITATTDRQACEALPILRDLFVACVRWAAKGDAILIEMPEAEMARAEAFLSRFYGGANDD